MLAAGISPAFEIAICDVKGGHGGRRYAPYVFRARRGEGDK
jgi:hypothetical protein